MGKAVEGLVRVLDSRRGVSVRRSTVRKSSPSGAGPRSGTKVPALLTSGAVSGAVWLPLALLCWLGAVQALAQSASLRLSLPISIDSPGGLNIREFARQVEARTGAAVRIELQGKDGKGRRYEEHEIVSAVASGAIDIGATTLNQFAYDVPLAGAFLQPFLFNFDALIQAATSGDNEIRTLVDEDILYWTNARVLWWQPFGSSVIVSKAMPATHPRAVAARAVGAPDDQTRELIKACGGTPHLVPPPDVLAALRKETIKAAATDIMSVREHGLWQVADTITNLRHAPSLFLVIINEKAWQSLAPEHREILSDVAQDAQSYMWARFAAIRADAYAFAVQKGMRIVDPQPEEIAAWRACTAPLLEAYMERAGDAGPKLFAAYGRLRTESCCREVPGEASFMHR